VPVLTLNQLSVSYQQNRVIDDLDLIIEDGEIVALFGPSGGGKSTVLKAVAGLLEGVSGQIQIGEQVVLCDSANATPESRNTGLIFQDYALFPHLTVAENIGFGLTKITKAERGKKVKDMLALIQMVELAERYPHELSGGQQQRIAIVRALACEPKILLFDEAFSNIDPQFRFELIADIRDLLKAQNIAALFVTHNQDEAFAFCDRIALLNNGKIEQIASSEQLFNRPATKFVAEFLGQGIWLDAKVESPMRLNSELGIIDYAGPQDLNGMIGKSVEVYLRPHQLQLIASANSNIKVEHERFVGECFESSLVMDGRPLTVKTNSSFLHQAVDIRVKTRLEAVFIP